MKKLSKEELANYTSAVLATLEEKPKTMAQQTTIYMNEIIRQTYLFDRNAIEVAYLKNITKKDLMQFSARSLWQSSTRKKLSVQLWPVR